MSLRDPEMLLELWSGSKNTPHTDRNLSLGYPLLHLKLQEVGMCVRASSNHGFQLRVYGGGMCAWLITIRDRMSRSQTVFYQETITRKEKVELFLEGSERFHLAGNG